MVLFNLYSRTIDVAFLKSSIKSDVSSSTSWFSYFLGNSNSHYSYFNSELRNISSRNLGLRLCLLLCFLYATLATGNSRRLALHYRSLLSSDCKNRPLVVYERYCLYGSDFILRRVLASYAECCTKLCYGRGYFLFVQKIQFPIANNQLSSSVCSCYLRYSSSTGFFPAFVERHIPRFSTRWDPQSVDVHRHDDRHRLRELLCN